MLMRFGATFYSNNIQHTKSVEYYFFSFSENSVVQSAEGRNYGILRHNHKYQLKSEAEQIHINWPAFFLLFAVPFFLPIAPHLRMPLRRSKGRGFIFPH